MVIKNINNIKKAPVDSAKDTYRQILISADEGPHFAMRRFIIKAGGYMPEHTNMVEHEQFVLAGKASVKIGDQIYKVKKGDVVFIPAKTPHSYQTIGAEAFEFLCIVPNKKDVIKIVK
jgi:quercetin dioxygenase-like cupin family protein